MNASTLRNIPQIATAMATVAVVVVGCLVAYRFVQREHRSTGDPVVAVVNDAVIHRSDLRALSPPVPSDQALALLVDFKLLDQAAGKRHATVSDAEMQQERLNTVAAQNAKSYDAAAAKLGRTPSGLDLQLRHVILLQKLSALEMKRAPDEMYHARGILISPTGKHARSDEQARAYADVLQNKIAAGTDIAALARQDSDDALSAPTGGDLGIIQLAGAPNFSKSAEDFKLQLALAGDVATAKPGIFPGGPIHGSLGYWVIEVMSTDARPAGDADRYQGVVSEWRSLWLARTEPGVMARLRSSAYIEPPLATPTPQKRS